MNVTRYIACALLCALVRMSMGDCPAPDVNPNVDVTCYDAKGNRFVCGGDSTVPVRTRVVYQCQRYYSRAGGQGERFCLNNGKWSGEPNPSLQCQVDCGRSRVAHTPTIVEGTLAQEGQWPWQVALYKGNETEWLLICGGTLIELDVVLTAAHCVSDLATGQTLPTTVFRLALGKYYRRYDDDRDKNQKRTIRTIVIHEAYATSDVSSYNDDIAILYLERPASLRANVLPVCSPHIYSSDTESHLQKGNMGWVSGWGHIEKTGVQPTFLWTTSLPFVPSRECVNQLPIDRRVSIPETKFCAGYGNDTNVCKGDSGGGLAFPEERPNDGVRWYLEGIVSSSITTKGEGCFTGVSFFTKVSRYNLWILETIGELRDSYSIGLVQTSPKTVPTVRPTVATTRAPVLSTSKISMVDTRNKCPPLSDYSHVGKMDSCSQWPECVGFNTDYSPHGTEILFESNGEYTSVYCMGDNSWKWFPNEKYPFRKGCDNFYFPNTENDIVRGRSPWHVDMYVKAGRNQWNYECSGLLVSPNAALFHSACIPKLNAPYILTAGDELTGETTLFGQKRGKSITKYVAHPLHQQDNEKRQQNLVIMITDSDFELSNNLYPGCIYKNNEDGTADSDQNKKFFAQKWARDSSLTWNFVRVAIRSKQDCAQFYRYWRNEPNSQCVILPLRNIQRCAEIYCTTYDLRTQGVMYLADDKYGGSWAFQGVIPYVNRTRSNDGSEFHIFPLKPFDWNWIFRVVLENYATY